jgi:hypothetical protein
MPTAAPLIPAARQHRVAFSAVGVIDGGSSGQRSVAALLQNRRMALEHPSDNVHILDRARFAATRHQPSFLFEDSNSQSSSGNSNDVMVEYREAGFKVSLLHALNASYWNEYPIYENGTFSIQKCGSSFLK